VGDLQTVALVVYVAGALVGLATIDARPAARVGLSICWPLGPAAFVVTIAILLVAATIAFPLYGALALLAVGAVWWLLT